MHFRGWTVNGSEATECDEVREVDLSVTESDLVIHSWRVDNGTLYDFRSVEIPIHVLRLILGIRPSPTAD